MVSLLPVISLLALLTPPAWAADAPGEVMPDRRWDVQHLHLDVRIDPTQGTVSGSTTHTVRPLPRRGRLLRLHQEGLTIASVTVDGALVTDWRLGNGTLDIPMPPTGDEHQVQVAYSAKPALGLHFRRPDGSDDPVLEAWSQGEDEDHRHWFPSWDYPNDRFTLTTRVEAPAGLHVAANGEHTATDPLADGWTAWTHRLEQPLVNYLVAVVVGDYEVVRDDRARVPFEYLVPRGTNVAAATDLLDEAVDNFAYLERTLGTPYPYPVYRQVLNSRFLYAGMENTTLTALDLALVPQTPQDPTRHWSRRVVSHELAHQWFGDLLTCYGWRELWLNEGFAEYYERRYLAEVEGEQAEAVWAVSNRHAALRGVDPMSPTSWTYDGKDNHAVYVRGAAFLRLMELHLGRATFDTAIRAYVADNADRLVETSDLRRAFEDASGTHLGWAFDSFVHGARMPWARSEWTWEEGKLTVTLTHTTEEVLVNAPVMVEVGAASGSITRQLWLKDTPTTWVLDLDTAPDFVAVDADAASIVNWTHQQTPDQWAAQVAGAEAWTARVVALQSLRDIKEASPQTVAVVSALLDDPALHPSYVVEAAGTLGRIGTADAIDALFDAADHPHRVVREASIDALARVPSEEPVLAHLRTTYRRSDDPLIRASALQVLNRHAPEEALKLARARLKRPDPTSAQLEHQVALEVIGGAGTAKDVAALIKALQPTNGNKVRQGAMSALVSLSKRDDDEGWRQSATKALWLQVHDSDLRLRLAAIRTLGALGDDKTEVRLRVAAKTWPNEEANAARGAAKAIRKRRQKAEPEAVQEAEDSDEIGVDEQLEALESRLKKLEERY